jgi:hypothetical protein
VKVTLVQALRLCTGRTPHRGSRGIALLFHDQRHWKGVRGQPGRSLPRGKTRYPLYRRMDGPQGRSGQVRKILPPTGIRSPDRPAPSQLLSRLRYPTHILNIGLMQYRQTKRISIAFYCCHFLFLLVITLNWDVLLEAHNPTHDLSRDRLASILFSSHA